jgi:hypothetical protein
MCKERLPQRRVRPRVIDKLLLARSIGRHVDGIWIGSWRPTEHVTRVERALLLVKQYSPLHYARIIGSLERIWIFVLSHGHAEHNPALKACVIDDRLIARPETSIEDIASIIVHEATHARLDRCGIAYTEALRGRIEAVCFRRELDFAARLPDSAELQERLSNTLDWYQDNQGYFSDTQFLQRHSDGEVETFRHAGVPDWLIRATPTLRAMISWARRLFRIIRPSRP